VISGLVLFLIDRWAKYALESQLTGVVLVDPAVMTVVLVGVLVLWIGVGQRLIKLPAVGWVSFGVLSNLIDVVTQRAVVDYLPLLGYITNIADLMIVGGCLFIGFDLVVRTSGRPSQSR